MNVLNGKLARLRFASFNLALTGAYESPFANRWGWVLRIKCTIIGGAHPLEKSAPGSEVTSIPGFPVGT